jgi:hypothetical protein
MTPDEAAVSLHAHLGGSGVAVGVGEYHGRPELVAYIPEGLALKVPGYWPPIGSETKSYPVRYKHVGAAKPA